MTINNFFFVCHPDLNEDPAALTGRVPRGINTVTQLLESIEEQLHFPAYFGCNWNALYDCLRDFDWTNARKIILVHDELPRLSDDELRIYLETLRDAATDWKPDDPHEFQVVFTVTDKDKVQRLLGAI